MRLLALFGLLFFCGTAAPAQINSLARLEPGTSVRIFMPSGIRNEAWVRVNADSFTVQREGLRRSYPLSALDSLQVFDVAPHAIKGGTIVGAAIGGLALGGLRYAFCDYNCLQANMTAVVLGAGIGALIGRGVGSGIAAAQGSWRTVFPN